MTKPLALIVNDDGIFSPGLSAVCDSLFDSFDLLIVAPHKQQTSMGRSYPVSDDLGVIERVTIKTALNNFEGYSVHSSPSYAVAYGVLELAERKPDLCISGINYGENLGKTITYSGTIGAVMQAAEFGIPSIAISRPTDLSIIHDETYTDLDWSLPKKTIKDWAKKVIKKGMPFSAPILNINVPEITEDSDYFEYTFQSNLEMFDFKNPPKRDFIKPFLLPSVKRTSFKKAEKGSDIYAVCVDNVISVTPLECNLTAKEFITFSKHHG
jgi:5'-nucleotidase